MEKFRQKILLLEVQLREHAKRYALKPQDLAKKEAELRYLKNLLQKIEEGPSPHSKSLLPSENLQEGTIIGTHWREKGQVLKLLSHEVKQVRTWVNEALLGKGTWKTVFRLSRLKKLLGSLEASQNKLNHDRRESERFFKSLHHLFARFLPSSKTQSLASLLRELDQLNAQILTLRTQIQHERELIRRQKSWLELQKEKLELEQSKIHDRHSLGAWKDLAF